ncbi:MAG: hypothetical protein NZM29_08835 [Nitrospira sp.]|nr:hypothetical protein [Nitrospira sp.]
MLDGGGSIPLPDAWADLAELERRAQAITKRDEPRLNELAAPIYVKDVAFYPPTVGTIAWARRVSDWFPHEPELAELALLYSLTQAKSREYLDLLSPDAARKTIHRWAMRCGITLAEAREVLELLFPPRREADAEAKLAALRLEHGDEPSTWPQQALREAVAAWFDLTKMADMADDHSIYKSVIFALMREFGGDLDYWIFDAPLDHLLAAADELLKRQETELAAERKAKGSPAAERWVIEAQERFVLFARAFERKYSSIAQARRTENAPTPPSATHSEHEG